MGLGVLSVRCGLKGVEVMAGWWGEWVEVSLVVGGVVELEVGRKGCCACMVSGVWVWRVWWGDVSRR